MGNLQGFLNQGPLTLWRESLNYERPKTLHMPCQVSHDRPPARDIVWNAATTELRNRCSLKHYHSHGGWSITDFLLSSIFQSTHLTVIAWTGIMLCVIKQYVMCILQFCPVNTCYCSMYSLSNRPIHSLTCPWHNSMILSNIWKISSLGWWIVRMTARFELATRWRWVSSSSDELASRPEVGSSRKMRLGMLRSWRATHKRLFCPPLSPVPVLLPTGVLAKPVSPVWVKKKSIMIVFCGYHYASSLPRTLSYMQKRDKLAPYKR